MFEIKDKEQVVETVKKSFFVMIKPLFECIILFLPGIYFLFFLDNPILNLISFVWMVIILSYLFYHLLNWYLDRYIITNQRIIEIKNKGVFSRQYTELPLERIDNFKCHIHGILPTLFDFGSVSVNSVSKMNLMLEGIPEPRRIHNLISEVKEKVE